MGAISCYVLVRGDAQAVIAVSDDDARRYGCPYCGTPYEFGAEEAVYYRDSEYLLCRSCLCGYIVLKGTCQVSDITITGRGVHIPHRSPHPCGGPIFTNGGGIPTTNRGPTATVVPVTNRRPPRGTVPEGPVGC
jgi:hypothetical protein